MDKRTIPLLAACLVVALFPVGRGEASPTPCLAIQGDVTWTKSESPHRIPWHPFCVFGTLTIEEGAEVLSEGGALHVYGQLVAAGSDAAPIFFSGLDGRAWDGIAVFSSREQPRSELRHVRISDARTALLIDGKPPATGALVFESNRRALVLENPRGKVDLRDSAFTNNRTALSGRSRHDVTVTGNDLWNNRINLLARPQHPWDCGDDEMTWSVTGNDILRGPRNDSYWSFDVRTPRGSRASPYVVDVSDNWWGKNDASEFRARTTRNGECCPDQQRKDPVGEPVSPGPHTAWEPPGPVLDPALEPHHHGDPAGYATITRPKHGTCYEPGFDRISGRGVGGLGEPPDRMSAAVRRTGTTRCLWWSDGRGRFVARACSSPLWFRVRGEEWSYRFARPLRTGRYTVMVGGRDSSRIPALNLVKFRITR